MSAPEADLFDDVGAGFRMARSVTVTACHCRRRGESAGSLRASSRRIERPACIAETLGVFVLGTSENIAA